MNELYKYFIENDKRYVSKWSNYFEIYERHFQQFVNKEINVLEIGVSHGGSLQMWKHYFGDKATIYGIDIVSQCKVVEEERIHVIIGDQGNREFWKTIKPSLPQFDIIIDDGGHHVDQQKVTFEEMFPALSANGVYLIEDLHTSYMETYGGGLRKDGTFIEYSKNIVDSINGWHSGQIDQFTTSLWSISYYEHVIVFEKRENKQKSEVMATGNISF